MRRLLLVGVLALVAMAHAGDKKKLSPAWTRPDQKADLAALPQVVGKQHCANWAWAAAVEAVLRAQNAPLGQSYWTQRLSGGEVCREQVDYSELARGLESDYHVLDDKRRLRLRAQFVPGAPAFLDDVILGLRSGRPSIFIWRGHAYLLVGMVYDELIGANGARYFEGKQFKLVDPLEPVGSKQRTLTFVRGENDPTEIDGMFKVAVVWQ